MMGWSLLMTATRVPFSRGMERSANLVLVPKWLGRDLAFPSPSQAHLQVVALVRQDLAILHLGVVGPGGRSRRYEVTGYG